MLDLEGLLELFMEKKLQRARQSSQEEVQQAYACLRSYLRKEAYLERLYLPKHSSRGQLRTLDDFTRELEDLEANTLRVFKRAMPEHAAPQVTAKVVTEVFLQGTQSPRKFLQRTSWRFLASLALWTVKHPTVAYPKEAWFFQVQGLSRLQELKASLSSMDFLEASEEAIAQKYSKKKAMTLLTPVKSSDTPLLLGDEGFTLSRGEDLVEDFLAFLGEEEEKFLEDDPWHNPAHRLEDFPLPPEALAYLTPEKQS